MTPPILDSMGNQESGNSPLSYRTEDKLEEFMVYVTANLTAIPNYADGDRHGASPLRPTSSNPQSTKLSASGL